MDQSRHPGRYILPWEWLSKSLILAPVGRDAAALAGLVERAGLRPTICATSGDLVRVLNTTVDLTVVAEEALYGHNLGGVAEWVAGQPRWSDLSFIVLS